MRYIIILVFVTILTANGYSQAGEATSPEATEMFKNVKSKLTNAQKNKLAKQLGFILSGNPDQPFALDTESKEYPFAVTVLPVDLNKDGKEEVFVFYGNSYTSGATGSSIVLFLRGTSREYKMLLGGAGTLPDILTTMSHGYPDILIGGPGMEFPVLRWNGKNYVHHRFVKDSNYEKLRKTDAETLSKKYQETL